MQESSKESSWRSRLNPHGFKTFRIPFAYFDSFLKFHSFDVQYRKRKDSLRRSTLATLQSSFLKFTTKFQVGTIKMSTSNPSVHSPRAEDPSESNVSKALLKDALRNDELFTLYEDFRVQFEGIADIISKAWKTGPHLSWKDIREIRLRCRRTREIRQILRRTLKCNICTGELTKEEKLAVWRDMLTAKNAVRELYEYAKTLRGSEARKLLMFLQGDQKG